MATCEPITIFLSDLQIIDEIAQKRAGNKVDLSAKENRKNLIQLRKEVLHDIIMGVPHREEPEKNK